MSLSPTVEPFIVIGYATFYMAPFFPAARLLRRIQARKPVDHFVWRHPLLSLSLLILAIGFVFDACLEIFLVRTQLYIYSHVIPWGSFAAGEWYQFPLIWESALVSTVMIPAGVLLHKDDTGKTQAEKLAQRLRWFRSRPSLGTFAVMFRDREPRLLLPLRRRLRADEGHGGRVLGGVPVAVPGGEGLRPAGLLRGGRPDGAVLPGDLVGVAERAARRAARRRRRRPTVGGAGPADG